MEFSNLGSHCSIENCRQQDFLPFQCDACFKTFCRDHRSYAEHLCKHFSLGEVVQKCPVCGKGISILPGIDINLTMSQHMDSSECFKQENPKCPKCNIKLTEINTVKCNKCNKKLCVSHRYPDQHQCSYIPERNRNNVSGFNCPKCSANVPGSRELIQHMRISHYQYK